MSKAIGRPRMYCEELATKICREVATSTDGLPRICAQNEGFPNPKTVHEWRLDYPEFSNKYDAAKRIQADLLAQEIMDIADDDSRDTIMKTDRDGNEYEVCNTEWIARSRLRVDTRKWIACKLLPKVYGEKLNTTVDATIRQEDAIKDLE